MNELNMSIYTGKNEENKVTLTAAFETHNEAVAFHNGLAELCAKHSGKHRGGEITLVEKGQKILGWQPTRG